MCSVWMSAAAGLRHCVHAGWPLDPGLPICWHLDLRAPEATATLQLLIQTALHSNIHKSVHVCAPSQLDSPVGSTLRDARMNMYTLVYVHKPKAHQNSPGPFWAFQDEKFCVSCTHKYVCIISLFCSVYRFFRHRKTTGLFSETT